MLDPKTPSMVVDYSVNWAPELGVGETIADSSWPYIEVGVTTSDTTFDTTTTSVRVSGGESGSTYSLINRVTTSTGQVLDHIIGIPVQDLV